MLSPRPVNSHFQFSQPPLSIDEGTEGLREVKYLAPGPQTNNAEVGPESSYGDSTKLATQLPYFQEGTKGCQTHSVSHLPFSLFPNPHLDNGVGAP